MMSRLVLRCNQSSSKLFSGLAGTKAQRVCMYASVVVDNDLYNGEISNV